MERCLGAGNNTFFWKDKWCDSLALKELFSDLYRIESHKDYMVKDRIHGRGLESLHWEWIRQPRRGKETSSLLDLSNKNLFVTLSEVFRHLGLEL